MARNVASLVRVSLGHVEERTALDVAQAKRLIYRAGGQRLYAAYVLGLLGLRQGEVLGLAWEDVDFSQGTISIRQQLQRAKNVGLHLRPLKSRRSRRTLPLPRFVVVALSTQQLFQQSAREVASEVWRDSGLVFTSPIGTPLDPRNFQRERVEFRDSVEDIPPVTFHGLRHTTVSLLLALGVPPRAVMEIAGHSGVNMTMNVYGHVQLDGLRAALDQLDTLMKWSKVSNLSVSTPAGHGADDAF